MARRIEGELVKLKRRFSGRFFLPLPLWDYFSKSPFLVSFLIVSSLFGVAYLFFTPYFQENDDVFKLFFAKGVGTGLAPSEYLGHSNILAGLLLSGLYGWIPRIPWYGFYLLVPLFTGTWAFLASLFLNRRSSLRVFFFLILFLDIGVYYLYQFEFAISPQLAAQGGLFLLAALLERKDGRFLTRGLALAAFLFSAAAIIRLDGLLLAALVSLPWLAAHGWEYHKKLLKKPFVVFLPAMALLVGGMTLFSRAYYESNPGWKDFLRLNHSIESLKDYRNPVYDEKTKPFFDEVGWTSNDLDLFRSYCYVDRDRNSVETYRKLLPHFSRFTAVGKIGTVESLPALLSSVHAKTVLSCFCLFLLFVPLARARVILLDFAWTLLVFFSLIYFFRCPERLYLPCLSFLAGLAVYDSESGLKAPFRDRPWHPFRVLRGLFLAVCLSLVPMTVYFYYFDDLVQEAREASLKTSLNRLNPRDDQLFVVWGSALRYEYINAFDDFEEFRTFHIYPLAVFQRSPHGAAMLERFGIKKNLFLEMVDNPRIFLVCDSGQGLHYEKYMREKFRMTIQPRAYFAGNFAAYRITRPKVKKP